MCERERERERERKGGREREGVRERGRARYLGICAHQWSVVCYPRTHISCEMFKNMTW